MRTPLIVFTAGLMLAPLVGRAQMTAPDQAQITSWLGDGPLVFTDIFTSDPANPMTSDQTLDSSDIGPAWGAGLDLAFGAYLGYGSELLNRGGAFSYSYGGSFGNDILGNPASFALHQALFRAQARQTERLALFRRNTGA
jgi:hypothetical protein